MSKKNKEYLMKEQKFNQRKKNVLFDLGVLEILKY